MATQQVQTDKRSDDESDSYPLASHPRPLFIYGTLCAPSLLAWVLTGDASNTKEVGALASPARVTGYKRYAVNHCDYPAVVQYGGLDATVAGLVLRLKTVSQRKKLDDFEGETYTFVKVAADLVRPDGQLSSDVVDADMYLCNGDTSALSDKPWDFDWFVNERLQHWLDLFEGFELVGNE